MFCGIVEVLLMRMNLFSVWWRHEQRVLEDFGPPPGYLLCAALHRMTQAPFSLYVIACSQLIAKPCNRLSITLICRDISKSQSALQFPPKSGDLFIVTSLKPEPALSPPLKSFIRRQSNEWKRKIKLANFPLHPWPLTFQAKSYQESMEPALKSVKSASAFPVTL